jgi:hypothetical protein
LQTLREAPLAMQRIAQPGERAATGAPAKSGVPVTTADADSIADRKSKSIRDWRAYVDAGTKPEDIPDAPEVVYAKDGWAGWGDWLGTTAAATYYKLRK